jgi:hypothetical protein
VACGPYYAVIQSGKGDPPPHIVSCSAFRAYENHPVHLPCGFDRRVFTGTYPDKRGVEPVIITAGRTNPEFVFDVIDSDFSVNWHDISCIAFQYDIKIARGLQLPG